MTEPKKTAARKTRANGKDVRGRPSNYTDALALDICEQIARGKSLHAICAEPEFPVTENAVNRWLLDYELFRTEYARARDRAADRFAAEIIEIADSADETIRSVEKARLRMDARKWATAKMAPLKYSERLMTQVTATVAHRNAAELTDDELAAIAAASGAGTADPTPRAD